ncbi:signal transduction histidine kinase [Actinoplanes octamycinicus]|uniref:histidine kinase n=1 Tax=Actinoplanes octamycinicus TaxID=135948 RepID=A0A7W7M848_9ACTN|nr:sensor histidine kinase [Actinoplanes octamycinicus]MBB4740524.1 signal transduction histidine kinase [Actinoplanes octamycinicus]GIE59784.1 two-component sensor histidine kinase [Actinoplanes octamycinicus]
MTRADRFRLPGALVDVPVAALLTYLTGVAVLDPPGPAWPGPAAVAWLAAAATGLPLVVRRRWPLPVFVVITPAAAVATAAGVVGLGMIPLTWFPAALALYTAASRSGRVAAALALAGGLAAPAVTIPWLYLRTGVSSADAPVSEVPLYWQVELGVVVVLLIAAWVTGRLIRWRRTLQAEAAHRLARDAVTDERLRIARELHDIVGHSLSLIAVKATVANHLADKPGETRAALEVIEKTSRSALTEIRRLLDVLRDDDDPAAELAPAPGAADLVHLADRLRSTGLRVELDVSGTEQLPTAVGLTVYRIVQESLTNVVKHADADLCWVTVRADGGNVDIQVADDGRGMHAARRSRGGQGLIGMHERVTMYGGTLATDPRPGGGFQVVAAIPYTAAEETA